MSLKNDRLLSAIARQNVDATPVWIMRQAGRYLPEYRAVRARAGSFLNLCQNPELACEVTLQPLRRFDLDASIIFSDILTVPAAMGLDLYFAEGEGPGFHNPIRTAKDIEQLIIPEPAEKLSYVTSAIRLVKEALNNSVPLIGFAGSPWTIACYMIEGKGKSNFPLIKKMLFNDPTLLSALLAKITESTILYLQAQIEAGADVLMLFDSWGGLLSAADYEIFSLNYMRQIMAALRLKQKDKKIPIILFTKGGGVWIKDIANSGCDVLGLDWQVDIGLARATIQDKIALQGNLDPYVLYASPAKIKQSVENILDAYGEGSGHIFNLGHGISPDVNPDHVKILVDTVHAYQGK
jgi:uroporphyrinogen decarboxylase